jgi:putative acetyltransferase
MEIRRYKTGEEPAVWNVVFGATHESIARDYHPDLIERWAPRDKSMNEWAARLAETNPFVAVVEGTIAGMAELLADGFIDFFYVHPDWQGKGIGKALLKSLESEAGCLAVKVVFADVSVTAREFFLSQGFRIVEAKSKVILGHPAPNFRMEKRLG